MYAGLRDLPFARALFSEVIHKPVPHVLEEEDRPRVRDQHETGQCWLYAGVALLESLDRDTFRGRYPDMVCLYKQFLMHQVQLVRLKIDDPSLDERTLASYLDTGLDDGGSWEAFAWLVRTHGVRTLPRARRDLPHAFLDSKDLVSFLRSHLRRGSAVADMHLIVERFLPDAKGDVQNHTFDLSSHFQIVNAPHHPLNRTLRNDFDNGLSYNVSMDDALESCRNMLSARRPVWASFNIDHEFDWDRLQAGGRLDTTLAPSAPARTRLQRVQRRDLRPNHAMLIVGHAGGLWRMHNSWGYPELHKHTEASLVDESDKDTSSDVLATDEWMSMNLFDVVVEERVVRRPTDDGQPAIRITVWDPLHL